LENECNIFLSGCGIRPGVEKGKVLVLKNLRETISKAKEIADFKKIWKHKIKHNKKLIEILKPNFIEGLTDTEKHCLKNAIKWGYYDFPRKINLQELSKQLGKPRTTLSYHLRRSESKIMNANNDL
tara:strand:+ start:677 stop:1054 length:378 start_codon:yes stop_codon:yes gene_type:complete